MPRSLPVLAVAIALVLLAAACGGASNPAPDPDTDAPTPTSTPASAPTYPLTGEPVEDDSVLERPVLAVKVDNHPRARPQHSLDRADVIMVEKVEGTTRFIALFHSQQAEKVGPVRSGRFVDGELLPSLQPAFAISGAAEPVLDELGQRDLQLYGEGSAGAWTRDSSRPAPHNLFLATEPLFEAAMDDGLPAAEQPWPYNEDVDAEGREVAGADMAYPKAGSVSWEWDGDQFLRAQDGQSHELADDSQVSADNVLIVRVPPTGDVTRPFDPIGSGELVLLRDGRALTGTWEKPAATEHFRWLGSDGEPLPLAPGSSWIELVPDNGEVTVRGESGAEGGDESDDAAEEDGDG